MPNREIHVVKTLHGPSAVIGPDGIVRVADTGCDRKNLEAGKNLLKKQVGCIESYKFEVKRLT